MDSSSGHIFYPTWPFSSYMDKENLKMATLTRQYRHLCCVTLISSMQRARTTACATTLFIYWVEFFLAHETPELQVY